MQLVGGELYINTGLGVRLLFGEVFRGKFFLV